MTNFLTKNIKNIKRLTASIVLLTFATGIILSQIQYQKDYIKNLSQEGKKAFGETFYKEAGDTKTRTFYKCTRDQLTENCTFYRQIQFDSVGNIVYDSVVVDTLHFVTQRKFNKGSIEILENKPKLVRDKYNYKAKKDSILLNKAGNPIQYYVNGNLIVEWSYDSENRIINKQENTSKPNYKRTTTYTYLYDSIIIYSSNRRLYDVDTSYKYIVFDEEGRLKTEKQVGKRVRYYHKGNKVDYDSILKFTPYYEASRTEYKYIKKNWYREEVYFDSVKTLQKDYFYLDSKRLKGIKVANQKDEVISETKYLYEGQKIFKELHQNGKLVSKTEEELSADGKIIRTSVFRPHNATGKIIEYNEKGYIIKELELSRGNVYSSILSEDD